MKKIFFLIVLGFSYLYLILKIDKIKEKQLCTTFFLPTNNSNLAKLKKQQQNTEVTTDESSTKLIKILVKISK